MHAIQHKIDTIAEKAHLLEKRLKHLLAHPKYSTTLNGQRCPIDLCYDKHKNPILITINTLPTLTFPLSNIQRYIDRGEAQGHISAKESHLLRHIFSKHITKTPQDLTSPAQLHPIYTTLFAHIKKALKQARAAQKPLLILIGENHYDKKHLLLQYMLLHIAERLAIDTLFVESSLSSLEGMKAYFSDLENDISPIGQLKKECEENIHFILKAAENKLHIIPCDPLHNAFIEYLKHTNAAIIQETEGWRIRQEVMNQTLLTTKKHALYITGALHLKDIAEDTKIQNHFHLVTINAPDGLEEHLQESDKTAPYHFAMDPTKALQVHIPVNPYHLHPQAMQSLAEQAALPPSSPLQHQQPTRPFQAYYGGAHTQPPFQNPSQKQP